MLAGVSKFPSELALVQAPPPKKCPRGFIQMFLLIIQLCLQATIYVQKNNFITEKTTIINN
jgi:hypothetical protein